MPPCLMRDGPSSETPFYMFRDSVATINRFRDCTMRLGWDVLASLKRPLDGQTRAQAAESLRGKGYMTEPTNALSEEKCIALFSLQDSIPLSSKLIGFRP